MYKKLENNINLAKSKRQRFSYTSDNNCLEIPNKMNKQIEYCSLKHQLLHNRHLSQQQKLLPESLNQSFDENKRINCIVRNQHSRTSKNIKATDSDSASATTTKPTTWLTSLSLFKVKNNCHQQRQQQKHQHHHNNRQQSWLLLTTIIVLIAIIENSMSVAKADDSVNNTNEHDENDFNINATTTSFLNHQQQHHQHQYIDDNSTFAPIMANNESLWFTNSTHDNNDNSAFNSTSSSTSSSSSRSQKKWNTKYNPDDSIFLRFAKRFTADNNLWSGIIQDCYKRPTFSCFQKNVYYYLNDVLDAQDVNVTQRLKFFKNDNFYQYDVQEAEDVPVQPQMPSSTQASLAVDSMENVAAEDESDVEDNEIPYARNARAYEGECIFVNIN